MESANIRMSAASSCARKRIWTGRHGCKNDERLKEAKVRYFEKINHPEKKNNNIRRVHTLKDRRKKAKASFITMAVTMDGTNFVFLRRKRQKHFFKFFSSNFIYFL